MIRAIENIYSSLIKNKINRILILNGHDGNIAPIELAARNMKDRYHDVVIACLEAWWIILGQSNNLFEAWKGWVTAVRLKSRSHRSVRPDLVDMGPKKIIPNLPRDVRIYWRFSELTKTGDTGAPRGATRAKGDRILHVLESLILTFINNMEKSIWKYGVALKNM